jgi:hypothetical protein
MAQDSKNHTPNLPDYSNSKEITPIYGGVGFLLATGVGYGIQKMRKKIKEGI